MSTELLAKLKKLQHQRSDSSPFASHVEFHVWADNVLPLLSFDAKLYSRFNSMVSATKSARLYEIKPQEIENINSAIGILNQAITQLEENSVPNATTKPFTNVTIAPHDWHEMPFGKIAIGVATTIIAACAIYLIYIHFGIKLN